MYTEAHFIDGCQVSVHVAGKAPPPRYLLPGGRHLPEGLRVGAHVGEDDQHVLLALVGQELGSGEGNAGRDNAFNAAGGGVEGCVREGRGGGGGGGGGGVCEGGGGGGWGGKGGGGGSVCKGMGRGGCVCV